LTGAKAYCQPTPIQQPAVVDMIIVGGSRKLKTIPSSQNMLEEISKSSVFLADITGLNHNVIYESGIAHALGKECIILSQDSAEKLPFDLRPYVITFYTPGTQDKLVDIHFRALEKLHHESM
jgi:hypothetical protein